MLEYMLDEQLNVGGTAANMVSDSTKYLMNVCDATMPRKRNSNRRTPVYWWNDEIATHRLDCKKLRRACQRARKSGNYENLRTEFKEKRKESYAKV